MPPGLLTPIEIPEGLWDSTSTYLIVHCFQAQAPVRAERAPHTLALSELRLRDVAGDCQQSCHARRRQRSPMPAQSLVKTGGACSDALKYDRNE